jgi:putative heme iron utilization protein
MADFEPIQAAKRLMREATKGALATLAADGAPYVSLVTVAADFDGAPILLLSRLARHTENLLRDARASLLFESEGDGDPLQGGRISLSGTMALTENDAARRRFLARHPEAKGYSQFTDFSFWRMQLAAAHLVAGFGRIVDLAAAELLTPIGDAGPLLAAEEGALAHMNSDHRDAIELYATRLLAGAPGNWRMISLDPEGCDLISGPRVRRLEFPVRITDASSLRKTLADLAQTARART